jgi:arylsulfatase A-like enzyme
MTDDHGWGDLGAHGNDKINTPHLDELAQQSVRLTNFYVSPVCAPTRASLMTGRYNYRTGAIDTYRGRAMMYPDEVTLAEVLSGAGYRTGIFGKWHLGDNYPLRAMDQGFGEALTLWGGGLVQTADPPQSNGNSYFNPWLSHNGVDKQFTGYCSDIYTDAAIDDIARHRQQPFFVYLAFNCPHTPLQVSDEAARRYQAAGLDDTTAKIYAMVENIDDNVGRLLKKLDELSLADNTIVVFLTDNGPQQPRYNGRWRGLKGSVYEGGIHVPCYIRWPARFTAGRTVEQPAAHIDLMPTLLAACNVAKPDSIRFDGRSLLPLLEGKAAALPDRNLFFQWHRGDVPERQRAFAVRGPRYKLVQAAGVPEQAKWQPKFELFDLPEDPAEAHNLAAEKSDVVADLKTAYDAWFDDVSATRGYQPPTIHIGTDRENPVRLARQDRRGDQPQEQYWRVQVEPGEYDVEVRFAKTDGGNVHLRLEGDRVTKVLDRDEASATTLNYRAAGVRAGKLSVWIDDAKAAREVQYVIFHRKP